MLSSLVLDDIICVYGGFYSILMHCNLIYYIFVNAIKFKYKVIITY
jgi:hypothetical protein